MDRSLARAWAAVLSLALVGFSGCQSRPQFKPALDDNPIRPGDVLLVSCSASAERFPLVWTVDNAGKVRLPYSGPWLVAGKKPSELAAQLSQYFSVHRNVTFRIEKLGAEFYQAGVKAVPKAQPKGPELLSPKELDTANRRQPGPETAHDHSPVAGAPAAPARAD